MSVVRELRTALEDTISPTLRELKVKLDALAGQGEKQDKRQDRLENRLERLESTMTQEFAELRRQIDTAERVRALELQMAALQSKRESAA